MTVSSIVPVNTYTGNSSVKKFDFDFLIENENELIVEHISEDNVITRLTLGVDYSINEIGNQNGSYIIFPLETSSYNILKENEKINLMLTLAIMQESEFKNSSYFNLNILEWTFDYIIRILQILNRKVERSIKVNEGSDILPDELVKNLFNAEANAKISETNAKQSETNAKASETATAQLKNETNQIKQDAQNIADKALQDISTTKTSVIEEINTTKTAAIASVNSTKDVANASVNATKDQAVQEVQTEGSRQKAQMQDYVDLAKDWANKTDGTVDGTEYSAKYYAEKAKDHSAVTYTQLMASPGYARGEVIDDTEGYQNVLSYVHSTFDLSKFTVVGSPTITEDGVASGLSNTNYIITNGSTSGFFECFFKFITKDVASPQMLMYENQTGVSLSRIHIINNKLIVNFSSDGTSFDIANNYTSALTLDANVEYVGKFSFNGSQYKIDLSKNNEPFINYITLDSTQQMRATTWVLGKKYGNIEALDGSIDLKSFAIWVDGVPVFNGNKTGLDIIKKDNYEVVGNPTITEDGVASGFSASNYIKLPFDNTKNNFRFNFNIATDIDYDANDSTLKGAVQLYINSVGSVQAHIVLDGEAVSVGVLSFPSTKGEFFEGYYELNNGIYTFALKRKNDIAYKILTLNDNRLPSNNYILRTCSKTSSDLNLFEVYVDGNLVYQPCLKIPYTLSKTGSKIVDVAYRDRVQDLYSQNGEALYYTIDEQNQNFTLPMGEVYGMITQKANVELTNLTNGLANVICTTAPTKTSSASVQKPAVVIENYVNGTSWYRVWSDGWIEQGGQIGKVGTDQTVTVTLLQPFSTTNYFVSNTNLAGNVGSGSDPSCNSVGVRNTSGFQLMQDQTVGNGIIGCIWYACGY